MALTLGSLFTGYGGLEMALKDVELKWVSDIEPGPCKLIAERFPTVPNIGDITQIDWRSVEPVDIIAGGSPCTDLSTAGQRAGMGPGTKSGLWESMFHAVQELRPSWVIWENVLGARSAKAYSDVGWTEGLLDERRPEQKPAKEDRPLRALGRVLGDLTSIGYSAVWTTIRASDVGAVHKRARVFVLAYPSGTRPPEPELAWRFGKDNTAPNNDSGVAADPEVFGDVAKTIERWGGVLGRRSPYPEVLADDLEPKLNTRFVEWLMGLPEGWVTDLGLTYAQEIQILGNGVVPFQAAQALHNLLELRRNYEAD